MPQIAVNRLIKPVPPECQFRTPGIRRGNEHGGGQTVLVKDWPCDIGKVGVRVIKRDQHGPRGQGGASLAGVEQLGQRNRAVETFATGGAVKIISLTAHKLRSIWK